jgi:hypothetical protein
MPLATGSISELLAHVSIKHVPYVQEVSDWSALCLILGEMARYVKAHNLNRHDMTSFTFAQITINLYLVQVIEVLCSYFGSLLVSVASFTSSALD